MADASIRSKPKRYDHPHANADHHHADHHHDADGSDDALGARDHPAKAGPVWAGDEFGEWSSSGENKHEVRKSC